MAGTVDYSVINSGQPLYVAEDIAFCNTREFTRTAQYFQKHGVYTKEIEGTKNFQDFWDIEEERCVNGMTLPGKLVNGKLQDVRITGEHYSFINFGPIVRTSNIKVLGELIKDPKHARKVGSKTRDFPDFWDGHYHVFKAIELARSLGLNAVFGKGRRKGFSYLIAWLAAYIYNWYAYRTTIIGAHDNKYLIRGDGAMMMARNYLDFLNEHTDWYKNRLVDRQDHVKAGYKKKGQIGEFGWKSQILGLTFKDNPDAAIGKDAERIFFEEAGKFPNLLEAIELTQPTMEAGDIITGQMIVFGTGGSKETNWEDFEKLFYDPAFYKFLACDNVWDDNAQGSSCGFFFPHDLNYEPHIDEHGNSLREDAKKAIDKDRQEKKDTAATPADYSTYIGQRPYMPSEAFSRSSNRYFYSKELEDQYNLVTRNIEFKHLYRAGMLYRSTDGIKLNEKKVETQPPIFEFPLKKHGDGLDRTSGSYVEWFAPYTDSRGKVPDGLYSIWHDPYATEKDKDGITLRDSFGATYVYENINNFTKSKGDIIVAVYYGRPPDMDDYNEQLFIIAERWNAKIMFENDRGDVIPYAKRFKHLDRLYREPEIEWAKELGGKVGRKWGMSMGSGKDNKRKLHGAKYFKDWLYTQRGLDENGNAILNLHYIYDAGLLAELLKWDIIGNFDRVSACIVGQYQIKETLHKIGVVNDDEEEQDDFFTRNRYKRR